MPMLPPRPPRLPRHAQAEALCSTPCASQGASGPWLEVYMGGRGAAQTTDNQAGVKGGDLGEWFPR